MICHAEVCNMVSGLVSMFKTGNWDIFTRTRRHVREYVYVHAKHRFAWIYELIINGKFRYFVTHAHAFFCGNLVDTWANIKFMWKWFNSNTHVKLCWSFLEHIIIGTHHSCQRQSKSHALDSLGNEWLQTMPNYQEHKAVVLNSKLLNNVF